MKKIVIVSLGLTYGGAERVICNLANHFANTYEITIITFIKMESVYKLDSKVKHIWIDNKNKFNENAIKKVFTKISNKRTKMLKNKILQINPDIIFSFLPEASLRVLKLKLNIPIIVCIRNDPKYEFRHLSKYRDYYYQKAEKIVVQDESFIEDFKYKTKFITIPNMIETPQLKKVTKQKIIINVGRLVKQKNQALLIKAFAKIADEYKDYQLVIYGQGKLEKKLLALINKLKLNKRVILKNNTQDIYNYIAEASVLVLSSLYEGMPNVLLEAIALNTCVVSTNCNKLVAKIINNPNYICLNNNIDDLADKIKYAINNLEVPNLEIDNNKVYALWQDIINKYSL